MKTYTLLFACLGMFFFSDLKAQCGLEPTAGTTTINTNQIVNSYFPGAGNSLIGDVALTIDPIDSRGNSTLLGPGDLIVIIQMQGAEINADNGDTYGDGVTGAPGQGYLPAAVVAGYYEYNTITSVVGSTINLGYSLANNYYNRDFGATGIQRFQVIRIPRNFNLNITAGGSVTTPSWNGRTGGVVILDAVNVLTIDGTINVSGLGFRGGGGINLTGATAGNTNGLGTLTNTDYRWNSPATTAANLTGGAKGEGIAGTPRYILDPGSTTITTNLVEGYLNGSMGRGAPGNGGGGATDGAPVGAGSQNQYNTGGGGGGNAGIGGQGGSGWHGGAGNVNTYPFGGHGGTAFTDRSVQRLVMGGGGGAGTANNSTLVTQYQSSGATGGGIILLRSGSFAGTGILNANGQTATGPIAGGTNTDSGGGGGAGGTIVAVTRANITVGLNGVTATAAGGTGGNMETYFDHGPGGGGGGGMIITNGSFASTNVAAGVNGLTRAGNTTNPITNPYGATPGTPGELLALPNAPVLKNANNAASLCGTLPITILTFTASLDNNAVQLKWEVADAINFSRFIVEHSTEGSNYLPIGQVNYNNMQTVYNYLHSPVVSPINYYRLKLVDIDGVNKYSNILTVSVAAPGSRLLVYPQPADDQVTIKAFASRNQTTILQVFNASGIKVIEKKEQLTRGSNSFLFTNLKKMPAGIYVLQAMVDGAPVRARIVVARH